MAKRKKVRCDVQLENTDLEKVKRLKEIAGNSETITFAIVDNGVTTEQYSATIYHGKMQPDGKGKMSGKITLQLEGE